MVVLVRVSCKLVLLCFFLSSELFNGERDLKGLELEVRASLLAMEAEQELLSLLFLHLLLSGGLFSWSIFELVIAFSWHFR